MTNVGGANLSNRKFNDFGSFSDPFILKNK